MKFERNKKYNMEGDLFGVNGKCVGISLNWITGDDFFIKTFNFNHEKYGDHRKKGYGTEFLKILEKEARENGCKTITAGDIEVDSVGFWERKGFKKIGETNDGYPIMRKILV